MSKLQLETPRLWLRLMQFSDLDDLLKVFGDSRVMASFDTVPFNPEQMENWVQRNIEHQKSHGYGLFSVILKSEGIIIGDCGLEHMNVGGDLATELGYDFQSDYWNQGYGTETASSVLDYAFGVLNLTSLTSLIRVGNVASRRVSAKIGMRSITEFTTNEIQYWKYAIESRSDKQI